MPPWPLPLPHSPLNRLGYIMISHVSILYSNYSVVREPLKPHAKAVSGRAEPKPSIPAWASTWSGRDEPSRAEPAEPIHYLALTPPLLRESAVDL